MSEQVRIIGHPSTKRGEFRIEPPEEKTEKLPLQDSKISAVFRRTMNVKSAKVISINGDYLTLDILRQDGTSRHRAFCINTVNVGDILDVLYANRGRTEIIKILGKRPKKEGDCND